MTTTPRADADLRDYLRDDNTDGYSPAELAALNSEFRARWLASDWAGADSPDEAAKWFSDEVNRRRR